MSILRNICIAEYLKETFQIFMMSALFYCVPFYCTVTCIMKLEWWFLSSGFGAVG